MEEGYSYVDHLADEMFVAQAKDLADLFGYCALALENIMVDVEKVEPLEVVDFELEGETLQDLLFSFLDELLFYKDVNSLVFSEFKIRIKDNKLFCVAKGEVVNDEKHNSKVDVKAITMHEFQLEKEGDYWKAQVLVDI
jgi:SHS2 domain-containing protein